MIVLYGFLPVDRHETQAPAIPLAPLHVVKVHVVFGFFLCGLLGSIGFLSNAADNFQVITALPGLDVDLCTRKSI